MVGLYPHIAHGEGLDSTKDILNEFKGKVNYEEWYVDGLIWLKWQLLYWKIITLSLMGRYIGKSREQPLALS